MPLARLDARLDTSLELLLERAPALQPSRVLATVVATSGSTYRKPGARMLIMADGSCLGLLSGGCLEADLKLHAQQVLESGVPRAIEYDMRGPDDILFGIGTGCEGAMRVLLEPAGPRSPAAAALEAAGRATRADRPVTLTLVHESADLPLGTYAAASPLPPALIQAAAIGAGGRRFARHRSTSRRSAHARVGAIPRAASASADLRSGSRCAARGGSRSGPRLAGFHRRPSAGLCAGRAFPGR